MAARVSIVPANRPRETDRRIPPPDNFLEITEQLQRIQANCPHCGNGQERGSWEGGARWERSIPPTLISSMPTAPKLKLAIL